MDRTRVLVVEDDARSLEATSDMLSLGGFEVRAAQNGALALEEVLTFRPEVVVFDFWMPVSDGRELLQGIREVFRGRLALVAMSGTPEVEDWCARVGVAQFVRKPFDRSTLVEAVNKALEEVRSASVRPRASQRPSQSRLAAARAVLLVGERETLRAVRDRLRDHERPITVAVVDELGDVARALSSFKLDALAVVGAIGSDRATLTGVVTDATVSGLPVVLDARNECDVPATARVAMVRDATPDNLAQAIRAAAEPATRS